MKIRIEKLKCKRCRHEWMPRTSDVRKCPRCQTAFWDVEGEKKLAAEEWKKVFSELIKTIGRSSIGGDSVEDIRMERQR
ncbi:MAG: hypothetical protein ACE5J5_09135 [Candidatus Hydrothermarchaeales archaeon]